MSKPNCIVMVKFRDGSASLVLYPTDVKTGIMVSRFHLIMEQSNIGEANVGGFGPIGKGDEGDYPLQMMGIVVEPKKKGKKALKHYATRPVPPLKRKR